MRVAVAAVGPAFGAPVMPVFHGPDFEDQGHELAWDERQQIVLEVMPDEMLGSVIDRAAVAFGVSPDRECFPEDSTVAELIVGVAFYQESDDRDGLTGNPAFWNHTIRLTDEAGSASWPIVWHGVKYAELVRSHEAGLVDRHPERIYFWPVIPQGDFPEFIDALWTLWQSLDAALTAYGAWEIAKRMRERIRSGKELINRAEASVNWEPLLRRPDELHRYLETAPRSTRDVAAFLGATTTVSDAERSLLSIGFSQDGHGLWRVGQDAAAEILRSAVVRIRDTGHPPSRDDLDAELRRLHEERPED